MPYFLAPLESFILRKQRSIGTGTGDFILYDGNSSSSPENIGAHVSGAAFARNSVLRASSGNFSFDSIAYSVEQFGLATLDSSISSFGRDVISGEQLGAAYEKLVGRSVLQVLQVPC